jgi:hypothetical protein
MGAERDVWAVSISARVTDERSPGYVADQLLRSLTAHRPAVSLDDRSIGATFEVMALDPVEAVRAGLAAWRAATQGRQLVDDRIEHVDARRVELSHSHSRAAAIIAALGRA